MEFGTPQEIGAKPGDVLMCMKHDHTVHDVFIPGEHYTVDNDGKIKSEYKTKMWGLGAVWRVVSRASDDTPKMWCCMTDEEKGALLLAHHEGEVIEAFIGSAWCKVANQPMWTSGLAYRVKPEPVRETVSATLKIHGGSWPQSVPVTLVMEDGKPDTDSIKMEEL